MGGEAKLCADDELTKQMGMGEEGVQCCGEGREMFWVTQYAGLVLANALT